MTIGRDRIYLSEREGAKQLGEKSLWKGGRRGLDNSVKASPPNNMQRKLWVFDVDETLLTSSHKFLPSTLKSVQRAQLGLVSP